MTTQPKLIVLTVDSMRSHTAKLALLQGLRDSIGVTPQVQFVGLEEVTPWAARTPEQVLEDMQALINRDREYIQAEAQRSVLAMLTKLDRVALHMPRNEPSPPRYARPTGKQRAQWKTERNGRK